MKLIRNLLYLIIGLLLGGISAFSYAGTYHATYKYPTSWGQHDSPESAFADQIGHNMFSCGTSYTCAFVSAAHVVTGVNVTYSRKNIQNGTAYSDGLAALSRMPICANGGTLSGTWPNETCTKSCTPPQELQPDGTCKDPNPCTAKKDQYSSGYISVPAGGAIPSGKKCDGTCEVNDVLNISDEMLLGKGKDWYSIGRTYTGNQCTGSTGESFQAPETAPPSPKKSPPCGPGEGVMTSSSGKVACVPEGNPDKQIPQVEKKKKVETYPDGSTKTTETTTTTDPGTGAKDITTTSTSSGGSAGSAGTTTSKEESSSTGGNSGSGTGSDSGTGNSGDGDGDCEGEDCGAGSELPDTSNLYEKKYPDGLVKVINDKITALKATALGNLVGKLVPNNLPSAGTCPAYSFSFNIGPKMSFGGHTLAMPCGVWDFIRVVFLITSLLLARRLIFGG